MAENFLTQDEVDALLNHDSVDKQQKDADDDNPSDNSGVRPYNMATQERIVRGRMPTYEIINARFARLLQIGIYNFMRRAVDIAIGPIKTIKYNEFLRTLVVPSNLNMVSMKPLRGTALIVFDPDLIFLIVDNMFGGDGRFHTRVEGREFTLTEQRIIQRLLEVVFEDYEKAWKSVYPIKFEYIRSEMNPQFASVATPSEIVVTTTFELDIGGSRGEFHVCIPYTMFEPIRELLNSSLQGDPLEVDKYWINSLSRQVQGAEVQLVANLGHTKVTLHQILNMQVGDVVPLDILDTVTAQVDGVPVMECHYGILNGHYALKVKTIRSPTETD
ncbi:flagellar motor switch protein FliM [Nitrosomonas sp. ANs5]|uniref:flagellar motor switch protein FliM n=1 Tax=Nitrosomonas sp. ANs5 TaxID=3423941 RepID=UPI003D34A31E